jgi:hypothetical protein
MTGARRRRGGLDRQLDDQITPVPEVGTYVVFVGCVICNRSGRIRIVVDRAASRPARCPSCRGAGYHREERSGAGDGASRRSAPTVPTVRPSPPAVSRRQGGVR